MKIARHVDDNTSYAASITLLLRQDPIRHRKLIVEGCVLAGANATNLVLHLLGKVRQETDIKHNRLEGFILRTKPFGERSFEISRLYRGLEDIKYRVVHGSSMSARDIEQAVKLYKQILSALSEIEPRLKEFIGES